MGKRFIDTNIFSDEWFGDLSKDGLVGGGNNSLTINTSNNIATLL